jgi:hypothetical protein
LSAFGAELAWTAPASGRGRTRVSSLGVKTMSGNTLNRRSEQVLLNNIPSPAGNHNGGDGKFGKYKLLYVSVGDGGATTRATRVAEARTTPHATATLRMRVQSRRVPNRRRLRAQRLLARFLRQRLPLRGLRLQQDLQADAQNRRWLHTRTVRRPTGNGRPHRHGLRTLQNGG